MELPDCHRAHCDTAELFKLYLRKYQIKFYYRISVLSFPFCMLYTVNGNTVKSNVCKIHTFLPENFWYIHDAWSRAYYISRWKVSSLHWKVGILGKLFIKSSSCWNKRINILWQMAIVLIVIGYSGHYSLHLNHIRRINWVALLNCQWGSPSSLHFKWA